MNATVQSSRLAIRPVPVDDPEWRRLLAECEAGPHLGEAWRHYREAMGWQPLGLIVETDGHGVGAGLAYLKRPRWRPWVRPEVSLDRAPWRLDEAEAFPDLLVTALAELAERERWRRLELHSFDGPTPPPGFDHQP